jgi:hypothetical protein
MNKHRIGALVAAAALTLTFAGTAFAATYAEVTGHTAHSSDANSESYWGDNCSKTEWNGEDETYVLEHDYALVVVKSGSGEFANTEFANASAGETVWADVNGNGVYDDDDKGISHIIFCDEQVTTTTTTDVVTTTDTTTTDVVTTTDTTTTDVVTTTDTTTTDVVTTDTTTTDVVTTDTTTTTPSGSVEELTPPQTDTISQPTSSSSVSTGLLLVLAGILAAVLVVVPAAARSRR